MPKNCKDIQFLQCTFSKKKSPLQTPSVNRFNAKIQNKIQNTIGEWRVTNFTPESLDTLSMLAIRQLCIKNAAHDLPATLQKTSQDFVIDDDSTAS